MKNLETRSYAAEFVADADSRNIHGLAIPVESKSELLGGEFYEIIRSTAINQELIDRNDVKIYLNHDSSQGTFARSKYGNGTLHLYITERGLEFEFDAPNTAFGDALLEGIRRGDYDSISFAFAVGEDQWDMNEDGTYTRSILSFNMLDECSILSQLPAYSATDVDIRSLEDYKEERKLEEAKKEEINKRLDDIMTSIDESIPFNLE
jgi:HK97 family phage prohead protease